MKKITRRIANVVVFTIAMMASSMGMARQFSLPPPGDALIGQVTSTSSSYGDTASTIAQRYDLGTNTVLSANPGLSGITTLSGGRYLTVPSEFLLPSLPRKGIIINLPEMRLYYYPEGTGAVMTFPIGIGKVGKTIPIANTYVVRKKINPDWIPTPAEHEFNEQQGIDLPDVMPAGPDNPLGPYAIYLGIPTFLIHSTIFPESIGRRASFGCIRMNENDIKQFFPLVEPKTPVAIVDMPHKVGWEGNRLYMESHPPLEERSSSGSVENAMQSVQNAISNRGVTLVNWQLVSYLAEEPDGIPHEVGVRIK